MKRYDLEAALPFSAVSSRVQSLTAHGQNPPAARIAGTLKDSRGPDYLVTLLAEVANRGLSGRFQLGTRKTLRRLYFVHGRPVGFWSDHPEDAFGRRFVDAGALDSAALRWTQKHLASGERIEEALVAGQGVTWDQVAEQQSRHIEAGIHAVSRMTSGDWEFRDSPEVSQRLQHAILPEVSLYAALWRGVQRTVTADQAVQWVSQGGGAFRCAVHLDSVCGEIADAPEGLVDVLKEGRTLEQVFEAAQDTRGELFQFLWFLECVGAISRLGGVDRALVLASFEAPTAAEEHRVKRLPKGRKEEVGPSSSSRAVESSVPAADSLHSDFSPEASPDPPIEKGEDVPVGEWREKEVPDNRGQALKRAEDLMGIGAYGGALSFLEDARFADPNNADILAALGWAHFKASGGEEFTEAEDYVGLALTFAPEHPRALEYRARLHLEKGEADQARGIVARLIAIEPKNRWAKAQLRQLGEKSGGKGKRGFGFWRGRNK